MVGPWLGRRCLGCRRLLLLVLLLVLVSLLLLSLLLLLQLLLLPSPPRRHGGGNARRGTIPLRHRHRRRRQRSDDGTIPPSRSGSTRGSRGLSRHQSERIGSQAFLRQQRIVFLHALLLMMLLLLLLLLNESPAAAAPCGIRRSHQGRNDGATSLAASGSVRRSVTVVRHVVEDGV